MPEAILPNTPSRRAVFAGAGALLAGAAIAAAPRPTVGADDASLIALLAKIDEIEDRLTSLNFLTIEEEKANQHWTDALKEEQVGLIDEACQMTATTLEGFRARARTIAKWAPDLVDEPRDVADQMVAALLQDLISEGKASARAS